jgi:hypothetical protein
MMDAAQPGSDGSQAIYGSLPNNPSHEGAAQPVFSSVVTDRGRFNGYPGAPALPHGTVSQMDNPNMTDMTTPCASSQSFAQQQQQHYRDGRSS